MEETPELAQTALFGLLRPKNIDAPQAWRIPKDERRRDDSYSEDSPSSSSSSSSSSSFADLTESPSTPPPPTAPIKKFKNVKKSGKYFCAVCGDRPTGYHYDVLSCNGCKTFFRRTVIAKRKFTCMQGGKCEFNKDFRCACRACRFAKCVKVGMNSKGIQFPAPTTSKKSPEEDERAEKRKLHEGEERLEGGVIVPFHLSSQSDSKEAFIVKLLLDVERNMDRVRRENYPCLMETSLSKMLEKPCALGSDPIRVYKDEPCSFFYKENKVRHWMIADLMLTVEYAKTLPRFRELSKFDQRVLLSNVAGMIAVMTQAYTSYEKQCDSIVFPDGTNALNYQLELYEGRFESHFRECYCRPVYLTRTLKMNRLHYVLLKAIVLFTPHDDRLTKEGRELIEKERWRLCRILFQLLRYEYGETRGGQLFSSLLLSLDTFIRIGERKRDYLALLEILMKVRLSMVGKEIFLKEQELPSTSST